MSETGALLLLAAGASRRMKAPKQLLLIEGQPLLRRVLDGLAAAWPTVVVVGAHSAAIRAALADLAVVVIENPAWEEGLGSSMRAGIAAIADLVPAPQWVIIGLGDQPDITADHLRRLQAQHHSARCGIVATRCAGVLMPPILFAAPYFPALALAEGDAGARSVVNANRSDVAVVDVAEWTDLDTPDDVARYLAKRG